MKIAVREFEPLAKDIFQRTDTGEGTSQTEDEFLAWGNEMLKVAKGCGGFAWSDAIELPPQFIPLYRHYQQTKGYNPDLDSCSHQLEDQTRRLRGNVPAHTPFTVKPEIMTTPSPFLQQFDHLTAATKRTFETLQKMRRGGTDALIQRSFGRTVAALRAEERAAFGDPVTRQFDKFPEHRAIWDALIRKIVRADVTVEQADLVRKALAPGVSPGDALGYALELSVPVTEDVLITSLQAGQHKHLGFHVMEGPMTKYGMMTATAPGRVLTPTSQDRVIIPTDTVTAGDSVVETNCTFAVLIEVSRELIQDGKTVIADAVLRSLSQGHANAVDYCAFQGNGNDDPQNGTMIGIFADPTIASAVAANGETSVSMLVRDDFINVVAAVAPSALVQAPRWYISPTFLPKLLKLRDGEGPKYLLKTPAQTEGEWELVGFPVTWAVQAPGNDLPAQKVAAFGAPEGYLVALQQNMEILSSDDARFDANIRQIRLANRGRAQTRQNTWLATLTLAAQ